MRTGANWTGQQLVELLARLARCESEEEAGRTAVEQAAEALEAEAGAIVRGDSVPAAIGFPEDAVPVPELTEVAGGNHPFVSVPGLGSCPAIVVPAGEEEDGARLILARPGGGFTREEVSLARGFGRVLSMTVRLLRGIEEERELRERTELQAEENARLVTKLAERQDLLEKLSRIQKSIVRRAALQETLDAIVAGASELIGDSVAAVRLVNENEPELTVMAAASGLSDEQLERERRGRVGEGAGGRAIAENRLVVIEDYAESGRGLSTFAADGLQAAAAAPVHEHGDVVGSLVVASYLPGRRYSTAEREALMAFSEHASLALTDARTVGDAVHQAFHDSLTGLPNRALFLDRLEHALARAARADQPVAVLFLDLDSFKRVNDSMGHASGDELLKLVAGRLEGCVRPGDTAARFGGDEFAILLEDMEGLADAERVAERVLGAFSERFEVAQRSFAIGASIGIASGREEADDLLRNADLAMYRAKGRGKNRYELFAPDMHEAVVERLELEVGIERAVDRGELFLEYQPIVRLRTRETAGVEALVRWNHPERGVIGPADFVPLAEESQAILTLGRWVLREACERAAGWRRLPGCEQLAVCVNLSAVQIQLPDLVEDVRQTLAATGLAPEGLILELTETVLMHDTDTTIRRLRQLKELGVRLAVDDFGTGYSSLQYLRGFPIDILKIAKSFVDGVGGAWEESALARAIIDLGGSFQLQVVAEGIESEDQAARLCRFGCGFGQGFHFAHPIAVEDVATHLSGSKRTEGWPDGHSALVL